MYDRKVFRPGRMMRLGLICLALGLVTTPGTSASNPSALQSASTATGVTLKTTLFDYLEQQAVQRFPKDRIEIDVMPINPLVLAKPCHEPTIATTGQRRVGRVAVHVKCAGPQPWAFYASAQITATTNLTVPARNILRGELITSSMLSREKFTRDRIRPGYLSAADDLIGRKANRSLRAKQPVYPHQIAIPHAVVSGDQVQIVAHRPMISIKSTGIALEDGRVGEQIRVRNAKSERLLKLWVWERGIVGTHPQPTQSTGGAARG